MKLRPIILGLTMGILWAIGMLAITYYPTITEMMSPWMNKQGHVMRFMMYDFYPIYDNATWYNQLSGALMGFIDGFVGGALIGYLYNFLSKKIK